MKKIGIKLADGTFHPILEEGITEKQELNLTTVNDGQTIVKVDLYRSETSLMDDAEYIDTLELSNLKKHPNGEPNINLNIWLDQDGHLSAELADKESGAESRTSVSLLSQTQNLDLEKSLPVEDVNFDLSKSDETESVPEEDFYVDEGSIQADAPEEGDPADMVQDQTPSLDDLDLDAIVDEGAASNDADVADEVAVEEGAGDEMSFDLPDEGAGNDTIVSDEPVVEETAITEEPAAEESIAEENTFDEMPSLDDLNFDLPDEGAVEENAASNDADVADEVAVEEGAGDDTIVGDEPVVEETAIAEEPAAEEGVAEENTFDEMPSLDDLNFDLPDEGAVEENAASNDADVADEVADEDAGDDTIAINEPVVEETKTYAEDEPMTYGDTLSEESISMDNIELDEPSFEETAIAEEPATEESVAEENTFDEMPSLDDLNFDLPDFSDTTFGESENAESGGAQEQVDFSDTSFDLPDFDDTDYVSTETKSAPLFDSDPFADDESNSVAENSSSSGALDFSDLYEDETEEDDDGKESGFSRTQKLPMIICLICAIICVLAMLAMFFISPAKSVVSSKEKEEKTMQPLEKETVSTTQTEVAPSKPVAPSAKEDDVVVIKQAETAVPEFPKAQEKPKPKEIRYKVKWGDTLWDLADSYYKNPWLYPKIAKYNNIQNPNYIVAGTYIRIPEE